MDHDAPIQDDLRELPQIDDEVRTSLSEATDRAVQLTEGIAQPSPSRGVPMDDIAEELILLGTKLQATCFSAIGRAEESLRDASAGLPGGFADG
jgi:hypothetical protein